VATDVLTGDERGAIGGEQPGGVESPGAFKPRLLEAIGQGGQ
jgi:hypothetical protein